MIHRLLLKIILTVFFLIVVAPVLHAEKRIGVILTGDIPYYREMHESFVNEIEKSFPGREEIKFILQKPFPDPISWSNAARKLVAFDVDLIVTYGLSATEAVLHEKSDIPLVYAGYYESDIKAPSGGKVTGTGFKIPLSSILRYFKSIKPINSIVIIYSNSETDSLRQARAITSLAVKQKINVEKINIKSQYDINKIKKIKPDAAFITGSARVHLYLPEMLSALKNEQIPAADIFPDDSQSGLLMTLFQPAKNQGQAAAELAGRILRGEKAAKIPPRTARNTELVFNLVVAKHLGISFPIHLLIESTRVIE